jgi:5'-methylthioadenosine phosphorylase
MRTSADVGVVGGSGFYSLFDDADEALVSTPYGEPAAPITIGVLTDRSVAFVPRHGIGHRFAPHRVPYRANLWALHSLGVRQVVAVSAVGSLTTALPPGSLVVPDQVVDRTSGREQTFYNDHGVDHVSFADPYCARGRAAAVTAGGVTAGGVTDGGTLVVVNGPRFSSRAESVEFQSHSWSIIGMTGMPEAGLARELGMCFTLLALVTDLDAGVEAGAGVTHAEVLAAFAANLPRLRQLLVATVAGLPAEQGDCPCGDSSSSDTAAVPASPPAS